MNGPRHTAHARPLITAILFGAATATLILFAVYLVYSDPRHRAVRLLNSAYQIIAAVASEAPDEDSVALAAADGMTASLDPYSQYLPPDRWEIMREETEGVYYGIGVEMVILDGIITVVSPIQGSPAHRAGMRAGDRIVQIDGEAAMDITSVEAARRIRGPKGSTVTLGVERAGADHLLLIELRREEVIVRPISIAGLTAAGIGYIRLSRFSAGAAEILDSVLQEFIAQGSAGWILDLRGNPGGLLDEAAGVAGCFLPEGSIVCETRGRSRITSFATESLGRPVSTEIPLAVLIDEGSASASEIVAAAIADHRRGVIVGRRSFGKGLVQSFFSLGEQQALQLTTGRYFTPGGYSFSYSIHDSLDNEPGITDDKVRDGGLIPHLVVTGEEASDVETELMQNGVFLNYIAVNADVLDKASFDELWDGFAAEIRRANMTYTTPLEFAFAMAESTAARSPAAKEWARVFDRIHQPLAADRIAEYTAAEPRLKTRLAESVLLFGGNKGLNYLPQYLELDEDTRAAVHVLCDAPQYHALREHPVFP